MEYLKGINCLVATGDSDYNDKICFLDLETTKIIKTWGAWKWKSATSFCELEGLNKLALGTKQGRLVIVDIDGIKERQDVNYYVIRGVHESGKDILALNWIKSHNLLISGSDDQTIRAFAIGQKKKQYVKWTIKQSKLDGANYIRSISIIPDKNVLICTHNNQTLSIWNINGSQKALDRHSKYLTHHSYEGNANNAYYYSDTNEMIATFKTSICLWKMNEYLTA